MYVVPKYRISIHAPRVGCDTSAVGDLDDTADFNPRTPGGVRQTVYHASTHLLHFNPRTPGGVRPGQNAAEIRQRDFNPRTPGGVRQIVEDTARFVGISIHAPRVGCDTLRKYDSAEELMISIHAPRVGCDVIA